MSTTVKGGVVAAFMLAASAQAETVEITLADDLDGILNGYCLDIAGGNENVDPANGLQGHTCYSYRGDLGTDQIFETKRFADGILFMPEYDVCATLAGTDAGTEVTLEACDGSAEQSFVFSGEGTITPASAPTMCLTLASDTRFGRGSQHQIKDLALSPCDDSLKAYQDWRVRSADD